MENSKTYQKIKNETFNIEKAINRISWRFKNENVKVGESKIVINELDIKAVEFLIEWINNQKQQSLVENLLFGKLYTYALSNEIEFYKDVNYANRKLQEVLNAPIEQHYNTIVKELNRLEYNKFCHSVGIVTDHIQSINIFDENGKLTEKGKLQQEEQERLIKQHQKELQKFIVGVWSESEVYKNLNNQITECINKYKNK